MSTRSVFRGARLFLLVSLTGGTLFSNCVGRLGDSVVAGVTDFILSPTIPVGIAACVDGDDTTNSLFCPEPN